MATAAELYALARRNQATMRAVENEMKRTSFRVLSAAEGLGQQQLGGFLRSVAPGLIDRFGQVNATAAMNYYNERKLASLSRSNVASVASRQQRQNLRRQASSRAGAELRSQLFLAQRPAFNAVELAQTPVNYAMTVFQQSGYQSMRSSFTNSLTRAVASYNRDTILYNSALDSDVVGVQRIAEPGACGFCQLQAVASLNPRRNNPSYAVEYHDNCRCSIETLYQGDELIRPDYYQDFEAAYDEAVFSREEGQTVVERFNQLVRTPGD
jgi:hypothetical protein